MCTSAEIMQAIRVHHHRARGDERCGVFEEFRVGTGYQARSDQRVDVFVIQFWPSASLARTVYEIKTSRADFLREVKDPLKRRIGLLMSNRFHFATPAGLLTPEEIPIECGLVELEHFEERVPGQYGPDAPTHAATRLKQIVDAPWRDTGPPSWRLFAALARRVQREERAPQ